jgi:hypothetical protein
MLAACAMFVAIAPNHRQINADVHHLRSNPDDTPR